MKIIKGNELVGKTFEVLDDGTLKLLEKGDYRPEIGDECYLYVPWDSYIHKSVWHGDVNDKYYADQHLIFRTKEEARECKRYYELLNKYAVKLQSHMDEELHYIRYNKFTSNLETRKYVGLIPPTKYYFKSAEIAMQFIREAGKHNIMLHMFDVWVD